MASGKELRATTLPQPREFDIGIGEFIPGYLYVRMAYSGGATDARLRRPEISSS